MEGIEAVQARIATIEAAFASRAAAAPSQAPHSSTPATGRTFSALLERSLGSTPPTPATQRTPGSYGRLTPPAELVRYGNGKIPPHALTSIGDGHRLHAPAAAAYHQMTAAATADGIEIGITDSYRDFESQVRVAQEKGLYSQGGLAAVPGTSLHGWGLAVDLDLDSRAQAWMRENAWRFGFVEDTPREPWHWTYRPD